MIAPAAPPPPNPHAIAPQSMGFLCCFQDPVDFDAEVNLFQFYLHKAVGKGAFGKVRVVEHRQTKKLYALKYIDKARCIRQKAVANIIQERRLLEEVDHPFVVNLRYAFQDDENCFFVLDLMLGGDLRFHLERKGSLGEEVVRFWVAELASALSYLHRKRIIHRDLKPDNILLDIAGHAHITDFNVAIHYSTTRLHTSVAGSLAYMAPEICARRGYSWQVDWWSLGIVAWELLFVKRPFEGRTAESLTSNIVKAPLRVPEKAKEICSPECVDVLKKLLDRNPHRRLGCKTEEKGIEELRTDPWFSSINWENLEAKEAQPPFVPDMKKANFDISHELDEFLMVDKPLTAQKRKANPDLEKMKPELRQLEEQFTTFDFTKPKRMSYYPHNQPITVTMNVKEAPPGLDPPRRSDTSDPSADHDHNLDPNAELLPPPSHTNTIRGDADGSNHGHGDGHASQSHTFKHNGPGGGTTLGGGESRAGSPAPGAMPLGLQRVYAESAVGVEIDPPANLARYGYAYPDQELAGMGTTRGHPERINVPPRGAMQMPQRPNRAVTRPTR